MNKYFSMTALFVFALFTLISCNKGDGTIATDDGIYESFNYTSTVIPTSDITEPTETVDVCYKEGHIKHPPKQPLKQIFKKLNLTEEQLAQVKVFNQQHSDCVKLAMEELRASEQAIFEAANTQRKAILDSLKDSLITKDAAKLALKELGKTTKEALKNNPLRETAMAAVKECLKTYFENIATILTEEQLVIWNEYLTKIGEKV